MKKICFILISVFLFQVSFCQENFIPGYVIQHSDTVRGLIDYRNWRGNPDVISFKRNPGDDATHFSPLDISSFGVVDEVYQSAIVETDQGSGKTDILATDEQPEARLEIDTAFLQAVIRGNKSLYAYQNKSGKDQFYISSDSGFELLIYRKYLWFAEGKTSVRENNKYKGQLMYYLRDCQTIFGRVKGMKYTRKSLEDLFLHYYGCTGSAVQFRKETEKTLLELGFIAAFSSTVLDVSGTSVLGNIDFPASAGFSPGLFLEIVLPRNRRRWSFYNEIAFSAYEVSGGYTNYTNENNYTIYDATLGLAYIKMTNMVRWKYPVGGCFVFLNAGVSNGLSIRETNKLRKETKLYATERINESAALSDMRRHEQGYTGGLGVAIRKMSFEGRYEKGNGMSSFISLATKTDRYHVIFSYRL